MERQCSRREYKKKKNMVFRCRGNADCSSGTTLRTHLFGS